MNVAIFVEKHGTAIWRLADAIKRNIGDYINVEILPVHPKRNDVDTLIQAQNLMRWADVLDIHYWKTGEILRTSFPFEFSHKPKMLFHFNPYDLDKHEWNKIYNVTIVGNESMYNLLPYANCIPYGIDLKKFTFNENYTEEKVVHMAVNRIEGKKGVLEVAKACKELGYKFVIIGRVSDGEYMQKVMEAGAEFTENATEEILVDSYNKAAIHVCNSVDNFESGTLPILEAMACGVPVLTRNIGHVPDLYNGQNMVVRAGGVEDMEDLKKNLKEMMENRDWRLKLRDKAWDTIKNKDERRMVRKISQFYLNHWAGTKPLVSVIVPTYDRPESLIESLAAIAEQDYGKIEIVVADSGKQSVEGLIKDIRTRLPMPVKYVRFTSDHYSLAEARNRAIIEAQGEILVFCDDRLKMKPTAVTEFAKGQTVDKLWQWGIKDGAEKGFVENFSCVNREQLIGGGMFNERIAYYGGMSQEIRMRFETKQGFAFEMNKQAQAESSKRAVGKNRRRGDIIEAKYIISKMYS